MSFEKSNLIDKKVYLSTAENVMLANLADMLHDIRSSGSYELQTTSILARAAAIAHQTAVFSSGRFSSYSNKEE